MNRELPKDDIDMVAMRLKRIGLPYVAKQFKQHPLATGKSWKPLVEDQLFMGNIDRRDMNQALKILWDWTMNAKDQGHRLLPVRFNTAASRVASRHLLKKTGTMDALSNAIDDLSDGLADIMDHHSLQWRDTPGLAKAQSDIMHSLSAYQNELEKFYGQEKARLEEERLREEERLEALVWEQQAVRFKKLEKAIPNAVLRTLGNTWDIQKESRTGRDASWDFIPSDWLDAKDGDKIMAAVAKAIAGSISDGARLDKSGGHKSHDLVVEFPYIRVGIGIETDSPDRWAAEEMREDGIFVPKKIIYEINVDVYLWEGE